MNKVLLALFIVGLVGCERKDDNGNSVAYGLNMVAVNGCQYVVFNGVDKCAMVHAGNCNNREHFGGSKYSTETGLLFFESYTDMANYADSVFSARQKQNK